MRQLLATLRRRPAPLAGTFIALMLAAVLVTLTASLLGTSATLTAPAQRLAATSVVVTGDPNVSFTSGDSTDVLALPAYRRLPAALAARIAAVPGVAAAVPDVSFAVALKTQGGQIAAGSGGPPITGHGWRSAVLTPFVLRSGHAPAGQRQLVLGTGLAQATGLRVGDTVRLTGQNLPSFTVVGLAAPAAATPTGNPAAGRSVFFSDAEARALYGHPGEADLIGVIARPGTSAAVLAGRIRAVAGRNMQVDTGTRRGGAEDLTVATDKFDLEQLALSGGIDLVLIALFVVAGAVALSVAQRWRNIALLRAIGATPGQVRRMMFLELAIGGALAGLLAYLPGTWLASWTIHGFAAHQLLPATARAWTSPWVLLVAVGAGLIVAQLAGFVAARRASRTPPAAALREANVERRWPHPVRIVLGVVMLGGGVALCVVLLTVRLSAYDQANFALPMLLAFMIGVALLGPLLVALAELAVRLPMRVLPGAAGRLALADIRLRPRRMASAVVSVALTVALVGAVYLIDVSQTHAAVVQGRQRLVASAVASAPGPGLAPRAVTAIARQPGVAAAVGLIPTTVFLPDPGNENTEGEAVTSGPLSSVLDLDVMSGSLRNFAPGDIAISQFVAGSGAMGVRVGDVITSYLADGTPYRATVTAIYTRSLGFGDVLVPAAASGGGHLGSSSLAEVLVQGTSRVSAQTLTGELSRLSGSYPGLSAASRTVVNDQAELQASQQSYANNLLLGLIASLAVMALVNTLVTATVERRESLRLLLRVGAGFRQLLSMTAYQTIVLSLAGLILGAGAAAASVLVVCKALTGVWAPYITWPPVVFIVTAVVALTAAAILAPTTWMLASGGDS